MRSASQASRGEGERTTTTAARAAVHLHRRKRLAEEDGRDGRRGGADRRGPTDAGCW
jgi:hypothetical protein